MTKQAFEKIAEGLQEAIDLFSADAFDGQTYEPKCDYVRLKGQLFDVHRLMSDGQWRTLRQIADVVHGSEAGVSARLRDLRKSKFGGHIIERDRLMCGLYRYRLKVKE